MLAHPRPFTWKIDHLPGRSIVRNNRPSRPGHYKGQFRPAIGSATPWWRDWTACIADMLSKRALPGRCCRASCEETVGSTGLGDGVSGVMVEEAEGAAILPGRGHLGPPGQRSRRDGGSNWGFVSTRLGLRPGDAVGSRDRCATTGARTRASRCRARRSRPTRPRCSTSPSTCLLVDDALRGSHGRGCRGRGEGDRCESGRPDESLPFQGDATSSAGQGHQSYTINFIDRFIVKKRTIRCPLVLVLLLRRAERNVNSRQPDTSGASAAAIFCSRSRNRQHTSDGTHR